LLKYHLSKSQIENGLVATYKKYSTTATFADDTAVIAVGESDENSTKKLQSALNKIAIWIKKWRIQLNESKSVHIDFTNKKITQRPI
jgi:thiamine phosphate synthase YjbQ (UPF0047 family)